MIIAVRPISYIFTCNTRAKKALLSAINVIYIIIICIIL